MKPYKVLISANPLATGQIEVAIQDDANIWRERWLSEDEAIHLRNLLDRAIRMTKTEIRGA